MTLGRLSCQTTRSHWKQSRPLPLDGIPPSVLHLPKNSGYTLLLDHLTATFPQIARITWERRFTEERILGRNGAPLSIDTPTLGHPWIWYYRMPENEQPIPFTEEILFQDEYLVVADKPHFLPVTPGGNYARETLLARLQRRLQLPYLAPLHRLDRETAGLVIFTVQAHTRNTYAHLFRERRIQKIYEAVAMRNPALDLSSPVLYASHMAPHDQDFFRMTETPEKPANSVTWIEKIEDLSGNRIRLRLQPKTGLRHQLRLHLYALGIPLIGDRFYPYVLHHAAEKEDYQNPLQLLAQQLSFTDPITGQQRQFTSRRSLGEQT